MELSVADVKRRFSEVLSRVEMKGERVIVSRRGKRIAAIVPASEASETPDRRKRGLMAAVGAWEEYEEIDRFVADVRRTRDAAVDREAGDLG